MIFQKLLLRFVWLSKVNKSWKNFFEKIAKWWRKPRWRISAVQFLKNSKKSTVKHFSILSTVLFSEKPKFSLKNLTWSKKSNMAAKTQDGVKWPFFYSKIDCNATYQGNLKLILDVER